MRSSLVAIPYLVDPLRFMLHHLLRQRARTERLRQLHTSTEYVRTYVRTALVTSTRAPPYNSLFTPHKSHTVYTFVIVLNIVYMAQIKAEDLTTLWKQRLFTLSIIL